MKSIPPSRNAPVESEEGQAHFRLQAALAALGGYCVVAVASSKVTAGTVMCVAVYAAYAYAWAWVVTRKLGRATSRQWVALALDVVVFTSCLAVGGHAGAALAWVQVTTAVGHGLRFGERRGTVAAIFGAIALFLAVRFGSDWQLPVSVALGVAITALVAPIYVVRLVRTIDRQRCEAESRAIVLEHAVRLDALTGVMSRTGLEAIWAELCGPTGHTTTPVGLVYLDLDGFKAINDNLGHEAGDMVLKQVAQLLAGSIRATDAVARLGGDEFAILVRSPAHEADVCQVATKAVDAIRKYGAGVQAGVTLGASAGFVFVALGSTMAEALREADERMFDAKRASPHRVARSESSSHFVSSVGGGF